MEQIIRPFFCIMVLTQILSGCGSSNAYLKTQNPNVIWMAKNAVKKKHEVPTNYCYQDEKYIYAWDNGSKKASKGMPIYYQIDKNNLDIVKSSKNTKTEEFRDYKVYWNEKGGWLIYDANKKAKIDEYKVMPIDLDKLVPSKDLMKIEAEKRKSQVYDNFLISEDKSKLTYTTAEYFSKEDKLVFDVICFDFATMNKLWTQKYEFPHKVKRRSDVENLDISINDKGEPNFIYKQYHTEKKKEKVKSEKGGFESNYDYVYFLFKDNGTSEEYVIKLDGTFVQSIEMPFKHSQTPIVVAYTYAKNNYKELKSILFKQINVETKEVTDLKEVMINSKQLNLFDEETGKKVKQSKGFQGVSALAIQKVHQAPDGSTYVLGETNTLVRVCTRDAKTGAESCRYYWQSGNILVTKINGDGTEGWSKIIPKSQYVPASSYKMHSHNSFVLDNKLHIFFNDYYKNYESSKASKIKVFTGAKASFIHTIVNPDGKYEMIEALGRKDHPVVVEINSIKKMDDDHVFLFDAKSFGKLKIDR